MRNISAAVLLVAASVLYADPQPLWIVPNFPPFMHQINQRLVLQSDGTEEPIEHTDQTSTRETTVQFPVHFWPIATNEEHWNLIVGFGDLVLNTEDIHLGVDIAAPEGSQVCATDPGIVDVAGYDEDLGNFIIIIHGGGLQTIFGHLKAFIARKGDLVRGGQAIASVGMTGYTTEACLHFAIMKQMRIPLKSATCSEIESHFPTQPIRSPRQCHGGFIRSTRSLLLSS